MKKFWTWLMLMTVTAVLSADVKVEEVKRNYHTHRGVNGPGRYFQIKNDLHKYVVYFQWWRATAKSESRVTMGIPEPVFFYGFVARGAVSLTFNGISSNSLDPREIKPFQEKDSAGITVEYNFDGIPLTEKIYMRADSPVLWIEWTKDPKQLADPKKTSLCLYYWPCFTGKEVQREVMTPTRLITAKKEYFSYYLKKNENYAVYYDNFYNPGRKDDTQSATACAALFDWNGIKNLRVWTGNSYYGSTFLYPEPNFSCLRVGLYKTGKRMTIPEFKKFFQENPKYFAEHPYVSVPKEGTQP